MDSHGGLDGLSIGGGGSSGSNPEFKVILYKSRSELFDILWTKLFVLHQFTNQEVQIVC